MTPQQRELLVARICSGSVRVKLPCGKIVALRKPTPDQLYIAQEVYEDYLQRAYSLNLYNDSELFEFLITNSLWDMEKEKILNSLPKEIDQFKVAIFKSQFKSKEKQVIRKALNVAKNKLFELQAQRSAYDFLSCSGAASLTRSKFLIGASAFHNDEPLFNGDFWKQDSVLLEQVMSAYSRVRISEVVYRDLVQNEPWSSIWATHKVESSVFGVPVISYTEEQRSIVIWATHYDNVYAHPNCPTEEVIADNDALDGWAIEQRRLRDSSLTGSSAEEMIMSDKIRNSQEVYFVADTREDARSIDKLNSESALDIKRQRFEALAKRGRMSEMEMPDTMKRLKQEVAKRLSAAG